MLCIGLFISVRREARLTEVLDAVMDKNALHENELDLTGECRGECFIYLCFAYPAGNAGRILWGVDK